MRDRTVTRALVLGAVATAVATIAAIVPTATASLPEKVRRPSAKLRTAMTPASPAIGGDIRLTSVAGFHRAGGMAVVSPGTQAEEYLSYDAVDRPAKTLVGISRGVDAARHIAGSTVAPVEDVPGRGPRMEPGPNESLCTDDGHGHMAAGGHHVHCVTETGPLEGWFVAETEPDAAWLETHCVATAEQTTMSHVIAPIFLYNASTGKVESDWHRKVRDEIKAADRAISESHKEFRQHMRLACSTDSSGNWRQIWVAALGITNANADSVIDCRDVDNVLSVHPTYGRADRRYMAFLDPSLNAVNQNCTGGHMAAAWDSTPGTGNRANSTYGLSTVEAAYWDHDGSSNRSTPITLQELLHTFGIVNAGSPGSDGLAHTFDYPDVMNAGYYYPGGPTPIRYNCSYQVTYLTPVTHRDSFMDCGGDDYWNDRPSTGNWLCTHFNLASDLLYFQPRSDRRYC